MSYDPTRFWTNKDYTSQDELAQIIERFEEITKYTTASFSLINRKLAGQINKSFFNILLGKKIDAQNRIISEQQKFEEDMQSIMNGDTLGNDDFSEEVNEVLQKMDQEAKIKFLQMYFDAYMAPKVSDAEWRLGKVTGTVLETDFNNDIGTVSQGEIYTRSAFNFNVLRKFWGERVIQDKVEYYSQLFFPPYKISPFVKINETTSYMQDILSIKPNVAFNQDTFFLRKEGLTYRDPGFKSISDNINFLQWLTENCTGVVSTYLTEWDLSIYMQEHLLTATINGSPLKLFLNYRVREDNPLSSDDGKYTDDRALCFNVAGCAISKIDHDCERQWRPSDFPLSAWWSPYTLGQDYNIKKIYIPNEEDEDRLVINYMDIYDNVNNKFDYSTKTLKEIFKQQDYIGSIFGIVPNFNIKYYQTFYTTSGDALSDFDVSMDSWLKKVSGAPSGYAEEQNKGLEKFIELAREEMILNGGYYGYPEPAGMSGGLYSRAMIKDAMGGGGNITMSSAKSKRKSGTQSALADKDLDNLNSMDSAMDTLNSGMNNKVDASTMAKFTGINRFAPALFGGPHGANYNPNTIQAYFDDTNLFWKNIPRISHNNSSWFTSGNKNDYFTDVNKFYDDGQKNDGCSPNKTFNKLVKGITNYRILYRFQYTQVSEQVNASSYIYNGKDWIPNFPVNNSQGFPYTYEPEIKVRTVTEYYTRHPWLYSSWWTTYHAYYNNRNTYGYDSKAKKYYVRYDLHYKNAVSTKYMLVPYKDYYLHDEPDVRWEIVHHTFENYNAVNTPNGTFWIEAGRMGPYSPLPGGNAAFILKCFGNTDLEKHVMQQLVLANNGPNPAIDLFFCQGNENNRYTEGPDSIFRAKCRIGYYSDKSEIKKTVRFLFWKWTVIIPVYQYIPFVLVDIKNSNYLEDSLNARFFNNLDDTGSTTPIHLNSIIDFTTYYKSRIIQKFRNAHYNVISPTGPNGGPRTDRGYPSIAVMGISGIGILSNIQGLDPDNSDEYPLLKLPEEAKDMTLENLPLKTHKYTNIPSNEVADPIGTVYWTLGGKPSYSTHDMDVGLKNAIVTIFTRALFVSDTNGENKFPGAYISIDTAFRNFLSVLLTQQSYLILAQDYLLESVSLEILRTALLTCVDKCVIKANGMNSKGEISAPDTQHVLYNFWIDQAIKLFGDASQFNDIRNQLKTEFARKINIYQTIIDELGIICKKPIKKWTFKEIKQSYSLVNSIKDETKWGIIEKFMFSYLNILYNYRFFFVAKRFNKENGTMWIMRALESILEFVSPAQDQNNPPPSPRKMTKKEPVYAVVFYELNNTTEDKQHAFINHIELDEDRIIKVYIKVKWMKKEDYEDWLAYEEDKINNPETDEVIEVVTPTGLTKYALKPVNGNYTLISAEKLENDKNIKWNSVHQNEKQRLIQDYDIATWPITWGHAPDLTPIRWNVFGNVNIDNLLEYSKESVTPEELICLIEEGADFWTVSIPQSAWPRKFGYDTKLRIKAYESPQEVFNIKNDAYITLEGPMAYSIYPITQKQERPVPGLAGENPAVYQQMSAGTDGFNPQQPS